MSDTQYPHVQAAFINAIREEGTKAEACDALQRQWNRACAQAAELTRLQGSLDQMAAMWNASQDLLAASKEVGFQFDELTRLRADAEMAVALAYQRAASHVVIEATKLAKGMQRVEPAVAFLKELAAEILALAPANGLAEVQAFHALKEQQP